MGARSNANELHCGGFLVFLLKEFCEELHCGGFLLFLLQEEDEELLTCACALGRDPSVLGSLPTSTNRNCKVLPWTRPLVCHYLKSGFSPDVAADTGYRVRWS